MEAHVLDENGLIINTIVVDSLDFMPNLVDASVGGKIGDKIVEGAVISVPAPVVIPEKVTRRQAIQALINHNLLQNVQPAIDSLDDGTPEGLKAKLTAQNEWDNSTEFFRDRPLVIQIGMAIGLDALGLDNMFIEAITL